MFGVVWCQVEKPDTTGNNGLYQAKKTKQGTWEVSKRTLAPHKFDELKDIFKGLNNDGRTEKEQKEIDDKSKYYKLPRSQF